MHFQLLPPLLRSILFFDLVSAVLAAPDTFHLSQYIGRLSGSQQDHLRNQNNWERISKFGVQEELDELIVEGQAWLTLQPRELASNSGIVRTELIEVIKILIV